MVLLGIVFGEILAIVLLLLLGRIFFVRESVRRVVCVAGWAGEGNESRLRVYNATGAPLLYLEYECKMSNPPDETVNTSGLVQFRLFDESLADTFDPFQGAPLWHLEPGDKAIAATWGPLEGYDVMRVQYQLYGMSWECDVLTGKLRCTDPWKKRVRQFLPR